MRRGRRSRCKTRLSSTSRQTACSKSRGGACNRKRKRKKDNASSGNPKIYTSRREHSVHREFRFRAAPCLGSTLHFRHFGLGPSTPATSASIGAGVVGERRRQASSSPSSSDKPVGLHPKAIRNNVRSGWRRNRTRCDGVGIDWVGADDERVALFVRPVAVLHERGVLARVQFRPDVRSESHPVLIRWKRPLELSSLTSGMIRAAQVPVGGDMTRHGGEHFGRLTRVERRLVRKVGCFDSCSEGSLFALWETVRCN